MLLRIREVQGLQIGAGMGLDFQRATALLTDVIGDHRVEGEEAGDLGRCRVGRGLALHHDRRDGAIARRALQLEQRMGAGRGPTDGQRLLGESLAVAA